MTVTGRVIDIALSVHVLSLPNFTVAPVWKLVPVTVRVYVAPRVLEDGEIEITVGLPQYSYAFVPVAVPLGVVTTTLTTPAARAGVFSVIVVPPPPTVNVGCAVPPNVTEVAPVKPVPVIVTGVPPAIGPDAVEMPPHVGTA